MFNDIAKDFLGLPEDVLENKDLYPIHEQYLPNGHKYLQFEDGKLQSVIIDGHGNIVACNDIEERRKYPRINPASTFSVIIIDNDEQVEATIIDMTIRSVKVKFKNIPKFRLSIDVQLFFEIDGKKNCINAKAHRITIDEEYTKLVFIFPEHDKSTIYGKYMRNRYSELVFNKKK